MKNQNLLNQFKNDLDNFKKSSQNLTKEEKEMAIKEAIKQLQEESNFTPEEIEEAVNFLSSKLFK
jgi:hypothetical protein